MNIFIPEVFVCCIKLFFNQSGLFVLELYVFHIILLFIKCTYYARTVCVLLPNFSLYQMNLFIPELFVKMDLFKNCVETKNKIFTNNCQELDCSLINLLNNVHPWMTLQPKVG